MEEEQLILEIKSKIVRKEIQVRYINKEIERLKGELKDVISKRSNKDR